MNFKINAVILQKKNYKENQIYLNILTAEKGILNVKLKINREITRTVFSSLSIGGLYEFSLFSGKFGTVADYIEPLQTFYKLRYLPERFAISQYFCEISYFLLLAVKKAYKHLSLLLNSIWLLENKKFSCEFIKTVFELRLLSISGYMPNLVGCKFCCDYEKDVIFFDYKNGFLICKDCFNRKENSKDLIKLSKTVLYAMRYIIYKEDKEIFKFRLDYNELKLLSQIVEKMVYFYVGKDIKSLKIYRDLNLEEF